MNFSTLAAVTILMTLAFAGSMGMGAPPASRRVTVNIEDLKFKPSKIEIEPGDTIVWVNNDDREHSLVAEDGSFSSGRLASGKSFSQKFDHAGKFAYGDDLHPRMHGTIIVREKK